jgi:VWFA-related protein
VYAKFLSTALTLTLLAQEEVIFRATTSFISVDIQVLSGAEAVTGLKQEDFLVWDNGKRQPITSFGADDQELDVILLLDVSQSTKAIQENIKSSAVAAMSHLLPRDRVGVVVFSDQAAVVIHPTTDREEVEAALGRLPPGRGGTELNATVLLTAKYLQKQARPGARRAIVMMSDNQGYQDVSNQAVRDELWATNVVFNLLQFRGKPSRGKADVREFVKATGGEVVLFRPQGVPLAELFQRLRRRYFLLYAAPKSNPGELREIRVELTELAKKRIRDARIRARTGYLAVGPEDGARTNP